ncbi:ImmA/IrrE family metallo-endopeptidase [Staphylococcus pseudintermedius]|uniref:ImmA/IrrE family metallo-endopeptidase n=3 Tax=Staphylococcus pseudintermedius TaxID=283734 RepID=UPI000365FA41|nr:ImmA/IrrE family metallo-endopeptidase [Staphylococcus pseudintermedius]EGQ0370620.1 ImmA/IrrE family metallo-endopeptidase [Staphylococcus pseudintermedius]EGQ1293330.1 ImmA/IrrE family metallo-endopeptidase [Staphylococcus pseudintermedius]EGQ1655281.1 ImmA/IrrE family metallo-endopeptidase [Staphylococcus pseudintermedius]EGQ1660168.1 ImmA/IrrE family metallo-endopeptidase [Staphylococcus pseudintermedius]EGQ1674225.1 ImmA/IrrE family metallo-endopeptidase [Staphylococcus pseudintermediu
MGKYEELLIQNNSIPIIETNRLPEFQSGLYINGQIFIKDDISTHQKHAVLAEEIAHYKYTYGNILDQSNMLNRKFELKARRLANESVITLQGLINAFNYGVQNIYDLATYFEVTKDFVLDAIQHYKQKYGLRTRYGKYIIEFEPLIIYKDL